MTSRDQRIGWPVSAVVAIGAIVVLAGGFIAWLDPTQLLPAGAADDAGMHLYAQRMAARALPLGIALLVALALKARGVLAALVALVAAVEAGDCISAVAAHDWPELTGGAVVITAFLWSAWRLFSGSARTGG